MQRTAVIGASMCSLVFSEFALSKPIALGYRLLRRTSFRTLEKLTDFAEPLIIFACNALIFFTVSSSMMIVTLFAMLSKGFDVVFNVKNSIVCPSGQTK